MALEKTDINLMQLKETKRSQTSGNVFGNLKGAKGFHPFGDYPIEALNGKTLNEFVNDISTYRAKMEARHKKLVAVINHQKGKIEELEGVLEFYGTRKRERKSSKDDE